MLSPRMAVAGVSRSMLELELEEEWKERAETLGVKLVVRVEGPLP